MKAEQQARVLETKGTPTSAGKQPTQETGKRNIPTEARTRAQSFETVLV